ncbi:MAG: type 4a pilus biogenesis protein PilO [Candidatus Levybacteria bacterium]|nr:type 4a pilus biogenesis protein PilO [Candidatus Levybacteria bacterium]
MQDIAQEIAKIKYFPKLPYLSEERSHKFLTIALTLLALSFFGLFAINPTVSTILKLKKELSDSEFIHRELETKIKNLGILRNQYNNIQTDLPIVTDAITTQPDVHILFAQVQAASQRSNVKIKKLQNFEVEVIKNEKTLNKDYYSYSFAIAGSGAFEDISDFVTTITNMQRVIDIDVFSISSATTQASQSLEFNIQATAFFKDNL